MARQAVSVGGAPEVVLDLSRLLSRVMRTTPTGVDRVELAYAETLLGRIPERLSFAARYPYGVYGRLQTGAVRQFLSYTAGLWRNGDRIDAATVRLAAARHLTALRPRLIPRRRGPRVFLQVSPHQLEQSARTARILRREGARFVCLVHDLIPIAHPEYARANGADLHRRRVETITSLAAGIITNSEATRNALLPMVPATRSQPAVRVAHLGIDQNISGWNSSDPPPFSRPYFVCVATIEPRKNHLLLLNIWRRMAEESATDVPALCLIGRRGWENEQVVDMLERCEPLKGHVFEYGNLSDREMAALTRNARALLLPSFVEGFGLPVAEALAAGTPVIAADIPALREVGQEVPDYIDPIAGRGWLSAVRDYARDDSVARAAQLHRLRGWRPRSWSQHVDTAMQLIDSI